MILILTTTEDATADYLAERCRSGGLTVARLNTDSFRAEGFVEYFNGEPSLSVGGWRIAPADVSCIYYRRPAGVAVSGPGTEAQLLHTSREWGAALDGFLEHIPRHMWMNHPAANAQASNKLLQLSVARRIGINVPETLITRSSEKAFQFWEANGGAVVVKPLSVGYVETFDGVLEGQIYTSRVQKHEILNDALLARCPTLLQEQVVGGTDVRVTIVDRSVTALFLRRRESAAEQIDIREGDMTQLDYQVAQLPERLVVQLHQLMDAFALRFAAIDLMVVGCDWKFLEVNPNGQWAWMDLLGVSDIADAFVHSFSRGSS